MTQQTINAGTVPNDQTGDQARTAFQKVNANFTEVYAGAIPGMSASTGSSLVGHIASGTGAVATTVQTKLRESVSVKDFGAVGDGVADDTAAITATIAAAGVGGNILVPAGMNCLVSSEVTFPVAGQQLSARGATFTKAASFTGSCVIRVAAINVLLNGLEIEGTDQTKDGVITSADVASGFTANSLKIRNCLYGISAMSNSNITISGCDIATTARNCIRAQNAAATAAKTNISITCLLYTSDAADDIL
jgi:hypothetical protein